MAFSNDGLFCSTVIPTIARPLLTRAVQSVLEQQLGDADFEVIVVNDSGQPLPAVPWSDSKRVRVIDTCRHDKSVARNVGAAIARGRYLHFLDDDDWMVPGAFESFLQLARTSEAVLLYGSSKLVDRSGNHLIELHQELDGNSFVQAMAGEWIPTGAYLVATEAFFAVGGYDPLIPAAEDIDLCRRIALHGDLAGTSNIVVYHAMGEENSSTDYDSLPAHSRRAREAILDRPGVFSRMRDSAFNSYWHGRIVRAYLTSAVWNLRHTRVFTAASRAAFGLAALTIAGLWLFSVDFWRAIARPYQSFAFARGLQEAGNAGSEGDHTLDG